MPVVERVAFVCYLVAASIVRVRARRDWLMILE
jgi:hypothetical protein